MSQSPSEVGTLDAGLSRWYGVTSVLLAILLAVPIWAVDHPPLVDYPNYVARAYILFHIDELPFAGQFESALLSTPSLAIDLWLLALQWVTDARTAGKIFLTATLWLWVLGWHVLGWVIHGRATWVSVGGALFAYHSMFFYGFTNFSFGLGVFLIALAAWMHGRTHWRWPRHVLVAGLAIACYYCHLSALIFLVGSAMAITTWECVRDRKITRAAFIDLLPLAAPIVFMLGGGGGRGFEWNSLEGKLIGALSLLRGYHNVVDIVYITAVSVLAALTYLWSTRRRAVGATLFTGLGCIAMFLIAPHELFGGTPADSRFLLPASALLCLSLDLSFPRRRGQLLLGFLVILIVFRIGMIGFWWRALDAELSDELTLVESLPHAARVYPIVEIVGDSQTQKRDVPAFHLACYAVLDRQAYVPHILAIRGHTPIRYVAPPLLHNHRAGHPVALSDAHWDNVVANFDYVWCHRVPAEIRQALERRRCTLVAERGAGTLWRVAKAP